MRRIVLCLTVALVALQACAPGCGDANLDSTIDGCSAAISHETNPANLAAYYEDRALAYERKGLLDQAAADYAKAVSLKPNFITHYNRAEFYSDSGHYDQAISDYGAAISNYEKSSSSGVTVEQVSEGDYLTAYEHRAIAYGQQNLDENAISDFGKVIALKPDRYQAYNNRGLAYFRIKQYDLAVADFTKVISLKPDFDAYYNRGLAYEDEGRNDQAIADFTESITRGHGFAEGYFARGRTYERIGQVNEALQDYHKAVASDPKFTLASDALKRLGETP